MPTVRCQCGKLYKVESASIGKKITCKACGASIPIGPSKDSLEKLEAFSDQPAGVNEVWTDADMAKIEKLKTANDTIIREIRKAVVGQERVVKELMIALFAQGHCLLDGEGAVYCHNLSIVQDGLSLLLVGRAA